jgi:hypothetical protein
MTEPDISPRATVWPLLEARQLRELTDKPLTTVLATAGPLRGLPEDRMVHTIVVLGHPTSAAGGPRTPKGAARIAKSGLVRDERSSESPA